MAMMLLWHIMKMKSCVHLDSSFEGGENSWEKNIKIQMLLTCEYSTALMI
jgi:hypothetical protein